MLPDRSRGFTLHVKPFFVFLLRRKTSQLLFAVPCPELELLYLPETRSICVYVYSVDVWTYVTQ